MGPSGTADCKAAGKKRAELLIKTKEGNIIQQPLVGIANKAKADMVRFAAEFGMTPSSRARIEITGTTQKENPFARNGKRPA